MKTKDYKIAADILDTTYHICSFVKNGLHRNPNKMYPVNLSNRLNIALKILNEVYSKYETPINPEP
ncbi:MAG: hypothetical protein NVS9B7_29260 [Flavisolibacter sp.]